MVTTTSAGPGGRLQGTSIRTFLSGPTMAFKLTVSIDGSSVIVRCLNYTRQDRQLPWGRAWLSGGSGGTLLGLEGVPGGRWSPDPTARCNDLPRTPLGKRGRPA